MRTALACLVFLAMLPLGCRGPNRANVDLRKKNQELQAEAARLRAENDQFKSDIRRLESGSQTLATLPQERLEQMWTVAGLRFGRLTGIDRRADGNPLKVYLKPVDDSGATLKAAGSIVIEAFDLDAPDARLGRWEFPVESARRLWVSGGVLNEYILSCPWEGEAPAEGRKLMVRATFVDALTQRTFEERMDVQ
jgi:hypothetical protein